MGGEGELFKNLIHARFGAFNLVEHEIRKEYAANKGWEVVWQ
jgi:hypothetical protein